MSRRTVLIIDDAYFMRNLLRKALKEADYEVVGEAKNGAEGVSMYFDLKPDIVTMDINMPEMTGIEATKEILAKDPKAKIIAVTGNNDEAKKKLIMDAGVIDYLRKPFQPAFLWTKLDKIFTSSNITVEASQSDAVHELGTVSPVNVITGDDIEESFEDMEIEILDRPDESLEKVLIIENNEDIIEFPDALESKKEEFKLNEENLTRYEEETNDEAIEPKEDISEVVSPIPFRNQQTPIQTSVEDEVLDEEEILEINSSESSSETSQTEYSSNPYEPSHKQNKNIRNDEFIPKQSTVTQQETNQDLEPIPNPNPVEIASDIVAKPTPSKSGSISIKPPRGRILRDDYSNDNDSIDEPILNESKKDNYNNSDQNRAGIFKKVKNLFKK